MNLLTHHVNSKYLDNIICKINYSINQVLYYRQTKKRKRKTSDEQYELYLNEMENDYVFRSGTINPTLGENYIENKWKSLVNKLNASGNGPQLPVEEWKRVFFIKKNVYVCYK